MKGKIFLFLVCGAALPAAAAPNAPLKCGANQEKVWVYDNLKTFDVAARLNCGTPVELIALENGFVRVRTSEGREGYVPAEALPSDKVAALGPAAALAVQPAAQDAPNIANSPNIAKPAPTATAQADVANPIVSTQIIAESAPIPAPAVAIAPALAAAPVHPLLRPQAENSSAASVKAPVLVQSAVPQSTVTLKPLSLLKPADYTTVIKKPVANLDDEDDLEIDSVVREDLSACNVFFSAYGVTPMQNKWIADDRRKKFPSVCPAPEPSMVDYVVIFTHDMNFFTTTLPEPIHTDANGFSDWTPVTSADSTLIPSDSLDRSHREYAWVFHVKRGTFDPAKFTSRRRPQFTKTERASSKVIEDAVQFMAGNVADR